MISQTLVRFYEDGGHKSLVGNEVFGRGCKNFENVSFVQNDLQRVKTRKFSSCTESGNHAAVIYIRRCVG